MNRESDSSKKPASSRKPGALSTAIDRLMDSSHAPGDERERAIAAKASSFGIVMGIYATLLLGLITAIFGSLLAPVVALALIGISSWSAVWYAHRHHVDMYALASQAGSFAKASAFAAVAGGMLLMLGAMAFTIFTGHALIELPVENLVGPNATGAGASFVRGAIIGGLIGCIGGLAALSFSVKKTARG